MEITFIEDTDYECPYCHNQLEDKEGEDIRVCNSEMCNGKEFRLYSIVK